jgi:orotate phosphoribosyltransferase
VDDPMKEYGLRLAQAGLDIHAIKLSPEKPFLWASGYYMPIYNDNRMFLFYPAHRKLITDALMHMIGAHAITYDVIAGTSTSGIPFGMALAEKLESPFIYVRNRPKDHGLQNQIEGIDAQKDLEERRIILIEDLVSTGGSSVDAIRAIRKARGVIECCLSLFSYDLPASAQLFGELEPPCSVKPLLGFDLMLEAALRSGYLGRQHEMALREWRNDPFAWGARHGFPKVEKGA